MKESVIAASVEDVFAFHERSDAFALLQPPWDPVDIIQPPTSLEVGTVVILKTGIGPFSVTIEAEHVAYEKNRCFEDRMRRGPFAAWHHRHLFLPHDEGCMLRDEVDYVPPLGVLGRLANPVVIRPRLQKMFDFRHMVTAREVCKSDR